MNNLFSFCQEWHHLKKNNNKQKNYATSYSKQVEKYQGICQWGQQFLSPGNLLALRGLEGNKKGEAICKNM